MTDRNENEKFVAEMKELAQDFIIYEKSIY